MHLQLRDEERASERRTPITPSDAEGLVRSGWTISVERSAKRIFSDSDYRHAGCEIVAAGSWVSANPDTLILGLKELPPTPPALANRMIHFAHIFKDQFGWRDEMERFRRGGGTLYDIEFLVDSRGRRAAAFGYWAGWMGAALALWRHLAREQDRDAPALPLQSFAGRDAVIAEIERLTAGAAALPAASSSAQKAGPAPAPQTPWKPSAARSRNGTSRKRPISIARPCFRTICWSIVS